MARVGGGGNAPAAFGNDPNVKVRSSTQAAELPGKLNFEINPAQVKTGDKYTVVVEFQNGGNAPIQIKDMILTSTVNGRKSQGAVPPQTKDIAPRETATLLTLPGNFWESHTTSWSMEVHVRTSRGETYRNRVDWK